MKVESTVNSNYTSLNTEVNMVSSPTYYGWTTNAYCGRSVADVGDFNDDGFSDFAVSCPDAAVNGLIRNGLVFVIFGTGAGIAVGGQLQTFTAGRNAYLSITGTLVCHRLTSFVFVLQETHLALPCLVPPPTPTWGDQ